MDDDTGFFVTMNGVSVKQDGGGLALVLSSQEFLKRVEGGSLTASDVDEEKIADKSKGNTLLKVVSCVQIVSVVIQCLARYTIGLPVTTLELVTVAYSGIALIAFCFWLHKPLAVGIPLQLVENPSPEGAGGAHLDPVKEGPRDPRTDDAKKRQQRPPSILGDMLDKIRVKGGMIETIRVVTIPPAFVLFGAVHCLGWNFTFPSATERLLWRVGSIYITCFLPGMLFALLLSKLLTDYNFNVTTQTAFKTLLLLCVALPRLFLLVEPFIAFRAQPNGVFQSIQWGQYIPHI